MVSAEEILDFDQVLTQWKGGLERDGKAGVVPAGRSE